MRRLLPIGVAFCLLGLTACTGEGDVGSLPSTRPSVEATADRTLPTRTEEPEPTKTTEKPEPTKTTEKPEPTRTTEKPEPTKTQDPEPTKTTEKPQPVETRTVEVTVTKVPVETTTTTKAPEPEESSAAVVVVAAEEDSGGFLGWLLLFLLFAGLAAAVLIARSRRTSTWDTEAAALAAETRMLTESRVLSVLGMREPDRRAMAWPPIREDLTSLSVRWGALGGQSIDGARQAKANGLSTLLRDLAVAVDAENEALVSGREWQLLRPQIEQLLDTIEVTLTPTESPIR
ncbi:hypothetical protein Ait01nite_037050 [Actinoplanes italicus]|uniref:Uncharacterized protein n=1 Tax=Actinoplanes italicus TaxID=113567 RepID=A0A2T0K8C4_9ACTN|nr:hypothetical protein [Actinoplanes italicus]PRX19324.1 hypothetical protein CLV67_11076 [Actinoplanes italicus]GIE30660.1 hypothetical protein Ait01nite_037050 [Actinoplanes italicus]